MLRQRNRLHSECVMLAALREEGGGGGGGRGLRCLLEVVVGGGVGRLLNIR